MSACTDARKPSELLAAHRDEIIGILREHGARNPRVFGFVVRGEDAAGSDLELLVTVDPSRSWDFVSLPRELGDFLGIHVDVVSDRGLKAKHVEILHEARAL